MFLIKDQNNAMSQLWL